MIIRFLTLIAAICFANAAQAQVPWSTPASACVPDHATINFNRDSLGVASVQHTGSSVDKITMNCPIAPFTNGIGFWVLSINYRDLTGTGTTAFVRAELYRLGLF